MKLIFVFILVCFLPTNVFADCPGQISEKFEQNKRYQVVEDGNSYSILTTSSFHDARAKKSLELLSKAALYKHIKNKDKKVTLVELRNFQIQCYYAKDELLYAFTSINKSQVKLSYTSSANSKLDQPIKEEIQRLETVEPKTKQMHEQLKELYFILGDIDNYNKQSDILMEILFNEN